MNFLKFSLLRFLLCYWNVNEILLEKFFQALDIAENDMELIEY